MAKVFTKKDIENKILRETKGYYFVNKKDLKLVSEGNAYVDDTTGNGNMSSLSTSLSDAKTKNPTDDTFIVPSNNFDGKKSNNGVEIGIEANSTQEASNKIKDLTYNNQGVKTLMNDPKSSPNFKVHLKSESIERLRESCVPFTKQELNKLLKNK